MRLAWILVAAAIGLVLFLEVLPRWAAHQQPAFAGQTRAPEQRSGVPFTVVTVARALQNPWGLAFLPDGRMLVTERPGRLRMLAADGALSRPVAGLPAVDARGAGSSATACRRRS